MAPAPIHDLPELRDRIAVFEDRRHAGEVLAGMLESWRGSDALVLAIPAGGVPVGVACARRLGLPLDVAVVSKVLLPWTTEAGFGAVAFDGTVWLNRETIAAYGLDEATVLRQVEAARAKVQRRVQRFRGDRPLPRIRDRTLILVDDGVAAGSTMRTAIAALRHLEAGRILVAVPTGHHESLLRLATEADEIHCANVRHGLRFAVADAYRYWIDVDEDEAIALYQAYQASFGKAGEE